MLRANLTTAEIVSKQCAADADRTIVTTALQESRDVTKKVVIIAEDIDVAGILTALCPADNEIFLQKPPKDNKLEEV